MTDRDTSIGRPPLTILTHLGAIRGWHNWKRETKIARLREMEKSLIQDAWFLHRVLLALDEKAARQ